MDKKVLAVFDFDGTITRKDTFNGFIISDIGLLRFFLITLRYAYLHLAYLFGLVANDVPKFTVFSKLYKGVKYSDFVQKCIIYSSKIDNIVSDEAMLKIKWHAAQGHELIIISASVVDWIEPWAKRNDFSTVIANSLELDGDILTGRPARKNCHGAEKLRRFYEAFPDSGSYETYVYGDSAGDRELLAIADHKFYRCFYK